MKVRFGSKNVAVFVWLTLFFSGGKPGFGPAAELLFFASPKKSNQKKGEPRPCRFAVPCATRSVRGRAKLASLRQRPPLSERCSVAQHGLMAVLNTPRLVRFANLAPVARSLRSPRGGWVASFLTPHCSQGHGTPCHYARPPHSSRLTSHHGQPQGLPLRPHSSLLRPHSSLLTLLWCFSSAGGHESCQKHKARRRDGLCGSNALIECAD